MSHLTRFHIAHSSIARTGREASKYITLRENSIEFNQPTYSTDYGFCFGVSLCNYRMQVRGAHSVSQKCNQARTLFGALYLGYCCCQCVCMIVLTIAACAASTAGQRARCVLR
jgi:hypothetical protein